MHDCAAWMTDDPDFPDEARRFLTLHYLRQFHRPVWRLIERQPESIEILRSVLEGEKPGTEPKPARMERGLLREIFIPRFLPCPGGSNGGTG
jgi:hypothetical protein